MSVSAYPTSPNPTSSADRNTMCDDRLKRGYVLQKSGQTFRASVRNTTVLCVNQGDQHFNIQYRIAENVSDDFSHFPMFHSFLSSEFSLV